ncbi:MAG TPA: Uma2 family endonuclease [Gemmataceae bacterium]|nr:Uma2 family endonuclease [Gemmataceae bacterium]
MTTIPTTLMTASEFWDWVHLPENRDRHFELERGKVVEVSCPGEVHGVVCANASWILGGYIRQRRKGYACANDTGIIWEWEPDTVKGPDVVFYDKNQSFGELYPKWTEEVPVLLIEVRSPNDRMSKINRRIDRFLTWGVSLVWLVDPKGQTVTVYRQDQPPEVLESDQELTGGDILPDFRCPVAEFFFMPGEANGGTAPPASSSSKPRKRQRRSSR